MSMTQEEAIAILQEKYDYCKSFYDLAARPKEDYAETAQYLQALQVALTALRGPAREQVEKGWKGAWKYSHTSAIDHFAVVKCSKCGHEAYAMALHVIEGNFCPACGAPMTDEAVQMVMRRLEDLHEEN